MSLQWCQKYTDHHKQRSDHFLFSVVFTVQRSYEAPRGQRKFIDFIAYP